MAKPLQYLLSAVRVVASKKVCFSDTQNPKAVCLHIDSGCEDLSAYQRRFDINNSNTIISKTKIFFFQFFFPFSKSILNFKQFPKKYDPPS